MRITSRLFNVASSSLFQRCLFFFFSLSLTLCLFCYRLVTALPMLSFYSCHSRSTRRQPTQNTHKLRIRLVGPRVCARERGRKSKSTRVWLCEGSSGSVKSKCRKFALHMPRRTFRVPTNCIALSIQNGFIIFASVNNSPLMTTATRTIRENNDTKSRKNKTSTITTERGFPSA